MENEKKDLKCWFEYCRKCVKKDVCSIKNELQEISDEINDLEGYGIKARLMIRKCNSFVADPKAISLSQDGKQNHEEKDA